jgi:hypothetical protein
MKIGDTIYFIVEDDVLFQTCEIVGETPRSWLAIRPTSTGWMREDWYIKKHAKKIPKSLKGYRVGTKREAELQSWAVNNAQDIADIVRSLRIKDSNLLATVARMVGYSKLFEEKINETA